MAEPVPPAEPASNARTPSDSGHVLETLWTLRRGADTMVCLIVAAAVGEELRVVVDGDLYLTEPYPHRDSLLGRAHVLHRNLLARGWVDEARIR